MSQNISIKTSLDTKYEANQVIKQQPKLYAKDSLDRFGDDLFGHLLSSLSLEDRFRLESVSKQFQRTVFGSVVDFRIDDSFIANPLKTQMLATIAMKCQNIRRLDCRGMTSEEFIPEVINAFGDHLRDIHCTLGPNSNQTLSNFGSLVTEIKLRDSSAKQSLIHCNRLSRLQVHTLSDVFDTTSGQLLAKNLQTFAVHSSPSDSVYDNQLLQAFVSGNQSLKRLAIVIDWDLPEMRRQLSRLTQLRNLKLYFWPKYSQNSLSEWLRAIGLNCKQLKQLSLTLGLTDFQLNGQTLNPLGNYNRLKSLQLKLYTPIDHQFWEPLKLCHRLTHLTLHFNPINGNSFQDCDKHLPRLQCLTIDYISLYTDCKFLNTEFLVHISTLPALQMLAIKNSNPSDDLSNYDFSHMLFTSPKLKCIQFNGNDIYCRCSNNIKSRSCCVIL